MPLRVPRAVLPFVVLIAAIALFAVFMAFKKAPEKKEDKQEAPFVSVERIELHPMTLTVTSQGLVKAKYETDLLAQVSGEIVKVAPGFVRGGLVKKGDLLAQIDPFNYEVKLQQARANLASARASFILERAQGKVAEAEWEKITSAEPSDLGLRKPQQEQALAAVKAAEAGVKQASKDLERTKIIAPFDALIAGRSVSPGTFVNIGTSIGRVMDVSKAEVRLPVPSNELEFLEGDGLQAPVELSATLGNQAYRWNATIARDEGVVDDNSRMFYLVAEISDPYNLHSNSKQKRLPFGTYVTAEITGRQLASAAEVPRSLLRDDKIALFSNDKLAYTTVEVVRHQGKSSIVTAGLNNGDMMITSSLQYPIEGMSLALEKDAAAEYQPLTTAEPSPVTDDKES
ncbi:efflux RND transporter periplasmic adaptor subunit [Teredinibacter turnerae]|uniref:efflux RND transporter periplasmic adaptor subunit n=1 Tax=Teredinibacter turnerae TaxID=2426 RepID=UPI000362B3DA|nr:efflux RND transporter periplasmic adaptor subunit [Teredinibacter turnerae]